MLGLYLKGCSRPEARASVSEGDLGLRFAMSKKMYHSLLRPVHLLHHTA